MIHYITTASQLAHSIRRVLVFCLYIVAIQYTSIKYNGNQYITEHTGNTTPNASYGVLWYSSTVYSVMQRMRENNMKDYDKKSRIVRGICVTGALRCELIEYSMSERTLVNYKFGTTTNGSIGRK